MTRPGSSHWPLTVLLSACLGVVEPLMFLLSVGWIFRDGLSSSGAFFNVPVFFAILLWAPASMVGIDIVRLRRRGLSRGGIALACSLAVLAAVFFCCVFGLAEYCGLYWIFGKMAMRPS